MTKKLPANATSPKKDKELFLQFLAEAAGNVSAACKKLGINRCTYYEWMKKPEFSEAVKDVRESLIDYAETALMKMIKEGNTAATIFFLKTQAKSRGYIEGPQVEVNIEQPKNIQDVLDLIDAPEVEHKELPS